MKLVLCLCPFLQIAAALPGSVGCGERMGLFPLEIHNGQRRFREVFALLALRPQPALLGKPTVSSTIPAVEHGWTRFSAPPEKAPKGMAQH